MRRNGLTLVEVVVVIFLIVVLIGLLLPALNRSRVHDSGRSQTMSNLKQCALAVHNYHDTYRRLPDGFSTGGIYSTTNHSLWFHLLPYVESDSVYKSGIPNAVVPSYNAPNDRTNLDSAGIVNFAANIRVFGYDTLTPSKADLPGVAIEVPEGRMKANLTLPRIVDGTTNVIMMTTRYADCAGQKTWYASDATGKWYPSGRPGAEGEDKPKSPPSPGVGGFMGAGSHDTPPTSNAIPVTAMYQLAPARFACVAQPAVFGHSFGVGGLSTALCDASVKNISPTMTPSTFARALCPGDQEKLDTSWSDN